MMDVVDAHHHLWDLSRGRYPWLQQDYDAERFHLGEYRALCRNFLPTDYQAASEGCNVVATVHVEAERDRSEQGAETAWLHEVHARHGFPNAVVAHAWFDRPDSEQRLAEQAAWPLVRGIRSKPVTSHSPRESVRGQPGTMQDETWLRGLSLLPQYGLSWDLRVPAWHLADAAEVAAMFPTLAIVLEHHGFAWDRSDAGLTLWRDGLQALAQQPNVHVKLSEFGLRDSAWIAQDNISLMREVLAIVGWQRCMFGSNFPVAGLRVGFRRQIDAVMQAVSDLPLDAQYAVMAGNALAFYRIHSTTRGTT
jgi:predicted TIM-barrel fold metal-dependent hydrolase